MASKINIQKVESRAKLKPRRDPYWVSLSSGRYLGFRVSSAAGQGTWLARYSDPDTGRKPSRSLGDFGTIPPAKRYDAAKNEAEGWFRHLDGGGSTNHLTVRQVCERYADKKPSEAERLSRTVYNDPIANIRVEKLKKIHVDEWKRRIEAKLVVVTRSPKKIQETRARSQSTINRDIVPLRAALNDALTHGDVINNQAWLDALKPEKVDGRRDVYLTKDQRRVLLENMPSDDVRTFVTGLCLLPLRVGALAALKVEDFNLSTNNLTVRVDKEGSGRQILLEGDTAALFRRQAKNKLPKAFLFLRADGLPWTKDRWGKLIKQAALKAGLRGDVVAYSVRHSAITDLVLSGLDLITVARISGTSVEMIEKHYAHLCQKTVAAALASLSL